MTIHATLDAALQDIARRSFYESAIVTPNSDGTFTVEDDFNTCIADDTVMWTYGGGMELPEGILDHSRLHGPAEFYDDAAHIRYNLATAVERLEDGLPVAFSYAVIDAWMDADADGNAIDEDGNLSDATVGWALLAAAASA